LNENSDARQNVLEFDQSPKIIDKGRKFTHMVPLANSINTSSGDELNYPLATEHSRKNTL
jgi:hypothetical protein